MTRPQLAAAHTVAPATLERLLLEHELHQVLIAYALLCDGRDWRRIGEVFSDDASATYGGHARPDRAAILAMLRNNLGGCGPTQHLLGNLGVDITTADGLHTVNSRIAVRAAHRGAGEKRHETYECMGQYQDRWCKTDQGWRIAHRQMVVAFEFGNRRVLGPALADS